MFSPQVIISGDARWRPQVSLKFTKTNHVGYCEIISKIFIIVIMISISVKYLSPTASKTFSVVS